MQIPEDYLYTKEHEWAKEEDGLVLIGITDYAQDKLGEIVYVELPAEGDKLQKDEPFGVVESTKNASDLFSPISGVISEVNDEITNAPELINEDAYNEAWLIKIEPDDLSELEDLMNAQEYKEYLGELEEDEED